MTFDTVTSDVDVHGASFIVTGRMFGYEMMFIHCYGLTHPPTQMAFLPSCCVWSVSNVKYAGH